MIRNIALLISLVLLTVCVALCSSSSNETDGQALLHFKSYFQDPFHALSSWNQTNHFCNWRGVICSRRHQQRVSSLSLSSLGLVGSLSPYAGNLSFLRVIDLGNNAFQGMIPQELGRLFRLQRLELSNNSFVGEFPINLTRCSHIRVINFHNNDLVGKIPVELSLMSNLVGLGIDNNYFTGSIPSSLGNLSDLSSLVLAQNILKETIPSELGRLSNLTFLDLSVNSLSGVIPASLYNITSLEVFAASVNFLEGTIPPDFGLNLPKLEGLYIGGNKLYGPIPPSIANASLLSLIDVSVNALTSPLPVNLGSLGNLYHLKLNNNSLGKSEGNELSDLLVSLSNCSNLSYLELSHNHFQGQFPLSVANLSTNLFWLGLYSNYITGSIPVEIGNLINLYFLCLGYNMLTGIIPDSIGKLSQLGQFSVYGTNISGKIPLSIGNMSRLSFLNLEQNMLGGTIPVTLGNCTQLQQLSVSDNHLTGSIPGELAQCSLLISVGLNHNSLTGTLPLQVGSLKNLGFLDVSENNLYGEIPATLGGCQVLEFLYMGSNLFTGTIPPSFKQLRGIQEIDFSNNNLSGPIPKFLGEFRFIQYLNLSNNMFQGEVPSVGVFRNNSAFSAVGNDKLCGGVKALNLPACRVVDVFKKRRRRFSTRDTALVVTSAVLLLMCLVLAIIYRSRKSKPRKASTFPSQDHWLRLSYGEIFQATNGFSPGNLIGTGRYGFVYRGILNSIETVAIKVLNLGEHGAIKSFIAECEALRNIRHRNLVKIITACSGTDYQGNDFRALVMEFMASGSLEDWLYPSSVQGQEARNLTLLQRIDIAIGVASALEYLHHHCVPTIVHCDLKPSNVLLDDDLCAHVGDFGLAKFLASGNLNQAQSSSMGIRGTVGYIAPEYGMGGEVSVEGDVYSYGILILEMFTGKKPTESMFSENLSLHEYAKIAHPDRVMEIVDRRIFVDKMDKPGMMEESLVSIIQIGIACSSESPGERMDVSVVLTKLHKIRKKIISSALMG